MFLLAFALVLGGPLVVVVSSVLLVVSCGVLSAEQARSVVIASSIVAVVAVAGAGATSALFRWCFVRPPVRGAALLTGLLLALFFLSHDVTTNFVARAVVGVEARSLRPDSVVLILFEAGLLLGVAVAVSTTLVLLVELPLRWVQGGQPLIADGTMRMLRLIGVVVILVASSSVLREEALLRLGAAFERILG